MKKKILIPIAAVIVVMVVAAGIYINDYYRADVTAYNCITQPSERVSVQEFDDGTYCFAPEDIKADTGIIFYPGGKVEAVSYAPLMEALAERGVMAVLMSMPANLAVLDADAADGICGDFTEIEHWYMAGHSLGGSMAASYLGEECYGFDGLILLASYSTENLADTELKVLSIYGSEDGVLDMEKYEANKDNLPEWFEEHVIEGGCHAYFGAYGPQEGDGQPQITAEEQIGITADLMAVFVLDLTV